MTTPGAVPSAVGFVDLVDAASLQALMDSYQKVIGLANAVIDLDGVVIARAGWQDLCTRFHRANPETCRRCIECDAALAAGMARGEHFAVYRCRNGLVDTASPVIVDGRHVANVFTGQFFVAPPDPEFFRRQAGEFGFDESSYLAAVARVPVISEARVEAIAAVYAQLAQVLATNGLDRLRRLETERRLEEANRGLARRTQELEAANKELEEFSYSMSHDMRAPLRALDGFSKILLEEHAPRLDAEGKRLLNVLRDNALRMGRLIDDILRFLRLGRRAMQCVSVDMADLAREAFAELQPKASHRRLNVGALPPAWGDREMLRQVLLNLLSNAVKFSAGGDSAIEIGGAAGPQENVYAVTDHGVGFDMRYVNKLFGVFERVHSAGQYEGTGIGLAIVKRIVERHGGRVWAEGKVGEGATFHFSLPQRSQ